MTDTKAVMDAINAILKRGNDAQIQRCEKSKYSCQEQTFMVY